MQNYKLFVIENDITRKWLQNLSLQAIMAINKRVFKQNWVKGSLEGHNEVGCEWKAKYMHTRVVGFGICDCDVANSRTMHVMNEGKNVEYIDVQVLKEHERRLKNIIVHGSNGKSTET